MAVQDVFFHYPDQGTIPCSDGQVLVYLDERTNQDEFKEELTAIRNDATRVPMSVEDVVTNFVRRGWVVIDKSGFKGLRRPTADELAAAENESAESEATTPPAAQDDKGDHRPPQSESAAGGEGADDAGKQSGKSKSKS